MKIISWNVNGLRAIAKKNFFNDVVQIGADIICVQETKAQDHQVLEALEPLKNHHIYANSAKKPGYSGTAIITKIRPLKAISGIDNDDHNAEGRVLCL